MCGPFSGSLGVSTPLLALRLPVGYIRLEWFVKYQWGHGSLDCVVWQLRLVSLGYLSPCFVGYFAISDILCNCASLCRVAPSTPYAPTLMCCRLWLVVLDCVTWPTRLQSLLMAIQPCLCRREQLDKGSYGNSICLTLISESPSVGV